MLLFELLDQLEEESDGLVVALYTQAHVAAVVLNDLYVDELMTEALNDTKESSLDENVLRDVVEREALLEDGIGSFL